MRKKIVWWLYIIYFLIIGVNAFGVHDNPLTNHDLASKVMIARRMKMHQKTQKPGTSPGIKLGR